MSIKVFYITKKKLSIAHNRATSTLGDGNSRF